MQSLIFSETIIRFMNISFINISFIIKKIFKNSINLKTNFLSNFFIGVKKFYYSGCSRDVSYYDFQCEYWFVNIREIIPNYKSLYKKTLSRISATVDTMDVLSFHYEYPK